MGKNIWLDPTEEEADVSSGSLVFACMPALGTVTSLWESGQMKPQEAIQVNRLRVYIVRSLIAFTVHGGVPRAMHRHTFCGRSSSFGTHQSELAYRLRRSVVAPRGLKSILRMSLHGKRSPNTIFGDLHSIMKSAHVRKDLCAHT